MGVKPQHTSTYSHVPVTTRLEDMTEKVIRLPELMAMVGLSRTTIYKCLHPITGDPTFPKRRYINGNKRLMVFSESEVQEWIGRQQTNTTFATNDEPVFANPTHPKQARTTL